MAIRFDYTLEDPSDFPALSREAQAQAEIRFDEIHRLYQDLKAARDPQAAEYKELLTNPESLLSAVLEALVHSGKARAGWQVLTDAQAKRIFRGIRHLDGSLVHPGMPGSRPPGTSRPPTVSRPPTGSGGGRTSAPSSAMPTTEEALEIFRRLYPQFLAEMGQGGTERLYAGSRY